MYFPLWPVAKIAYFLLWILPVWLHHKIQKTREEKNSWWHCMGHQLNLSFSTFRNRIAVSLEWTNSLGHINKTNYFYFYFSNKRVFFFLRLELLCFPWSIGTVFYGLWNITKIRGEKTIFFHNNLFLEKEGQTSKKKFGKILQ